MSASLARSVFRSSVLAAALLALAAPARAHDMAAPADASMDPMGPQLGTDWQVSLAARVMY